MNEYLIENTSATAQLDKTVPDLRTKLSLPSHGVKCWGVGGGEYNFNWSNFNWWEEGAESPPHV